MISGRVTYGSTAPRVRAFAVRALRMALAFALAFGTTLWAQNAYGDDADGGGGSQVTEGADSGQGESGESGAQPVDIKDGGQEETGGQSPGESSGSTADDRPQGPDAEQEDELHIVDVGVFLHGSNKDAYAFATTSSATSGNISKAVIEKRAGQLDFDAAILWDDGNDWEYDSGKVSWRMAQGDEALASLSPTGILEARGIENGTVTVTAFVSGEYTQDGQELAASFKVELRGQTDKKYVKKIRICDDTGNVIDPSYRFEAGTLATAMLELSARVTVHDPATEKDNELLVTPSSSLSKQTSGEVADLVWESADTRLGTVSEEGIYRPAVAAVNIVYAASNAGFNGKRVQAKATIDMPPDPGKEAANGYHPQSTLTIKVYYEDYPDQQVGEDVVFTVADLEALGTKTLTYTALKGDQGYMTTTGRGPLLTKVLKAAGVNTKGVKSLRFGTPDNYQGVVSWDLLVDKNRYYFPNIDIGQYTEKVQVAPMIAIDAYRNVGSDVSVHKKGLTDTRRFLLLFGAKATGETTTNLQVYNIHTIYVTLEGSPPVQKAGAKVNVRFVDGVTGNVLKSVNTATPDKVAAPDAPAHNGYTFTGWTKSTDASGNVTFTAEYAQNGRSTQKGTNGTGAGAGTGAGNGAGADSGTDGSTGAGSNIAQPGRSGGSTRDLVDVAQQGGADGTAGDALDAAESAQGAETNVTQLDPNDVTTLSSGRFSVLQAINSHPSNVDDLMLENPLAPYAAPLFAGIFCMGGLEAGLAFWRGRRIPKGVQLPV